MRMRKVVLNPSNENTTLDIMGTDCINFILTVADNLKEYQAAAVQWMLEKRRQPWWRHFGRWNGTGQNRYTPPTIQFDIIVTTLALINTINTNILLLVPPTLLQNWTTEIQKWLPNAAFKVVSKSRQLEVLQQPPILLVSQYVLRKVYSAPRRKKDANIRLKLNKAGVGWRSLHCQR